MQKIKIHINNGYIRDIEGIWHRLDAASMFYVRVERKKGKYYSQVLGEYKASTYDYSYAGRRCHNPGVIEFTRVLGGKKKAQQVLDEAFGIEDANGCTTWIQKRKKRD